LLTQTIRKKCADSSVWLSAKKDSVSRKQWWLPSIRQLLRQQCHSTQYNINAIRQLRLAAFTRPNNCASGAFRPIKSVPPKERPYFNLVGGHGGRKRGLLQRPLAPAVIYCCPWHVLKNIRRLAQRK